MMAWPLKSKPIARSKSLPAISTAWSIRAGRSHGAIWRVLRRLKLSMWVTIFAARAPACWMPSSNCGTSRICRYWLTVASSMPACSATSRFFGRSGDRRRRMFCTLCRIAPSGLLISWAMPAARPPTDSIFSDCTIISSRDRRWVMSSIRITTPRPAPPING
ncbi:hypothetical protein D3C84_757330 [compost metagenome]